MAVPSTFDDGNVVEWLAKFAVCATANQWDDAAQLRRLPTFLSGRAFAVFQRLRDEQRDTIQHLTAAITEAYLPVEARGAKYLEFQVAGYKTDEPVETYVYRIESLLSQALPALQDESRDQILKQKFIAGLPELIKNKLYENPTLTYQQCIVTARQLFAAQKQKALDVQSGVVIKSEAPMMTPKQEPVNSASGMQFQTQNAYRPRYSQYSNNSSLRTNTSNRFSNQNEFRSGKRCFNCGIFGHIARDCRKPPQNRSQFELRKQESSYGSQYNPSTKQGSSNSQLNRQSSKKANGVSASEGESEYFVDGVIDGKELAFLLDCGATNSFISLDCFSALFPDREYKETSSDHTAISFNGAIVQILGSFEAEVIFGSYKVISSFQIVEDMRYEAILGNNYLEEHTRSIKLQKKYIKMKDKSCIKLRKKKISDTSRCSLVVAETVIVQPRSQQFVACRLN